MVIVSVQFNLYVLIFLDVQIRAVLMCKRAFSNYISFPIYHNSETES